MSASLPPPAAAPPIRALTSLLAFWADAGVESLYADHPVDRTATPPARQSAPPARPVAGAARPAPGGPDLEDPVLAARQAADGASDLESLRRALEAFDGCGLKAPGRSLVFARGAADAAVVVVGDAPGADDEAAGAPGSGAAGRLLDRMLAAASLDGRALVINTVFWRPPGDRAATAAELRVCAPFLERAIALVAPTALLLLGARSARAMLGREEDILALRGRWLEWRGIGGAAELPALATLSPALLLRQPLAKRQAWRDLLILAERLGRPSRPG